MKMKKVLNASEPAAIKQNPRGRRLHVCSGQLGGPELPQPLGCEGMHAGAEEGSHLLLSHRISSAETINAGHAGAYPRAWCFSAFGVVGGQPDMALFGGI
jgi:hypothetical protein